MRPRRSCLSVPGSSAKMLGKARTLEADEIVIDLEDAVAPALKDEARRAVADALGTGEWTAPTLSVRVNGTTTRWCHRDVVAVVQAAGAALSSLVIPKVERPRDVEFVETLLDSIETELAESGSPRAAPIGLVALIETAAGLRAVDAIAASSRRLEGLILGYADLGASLGRPASASPSSPVWDGARETVLVAARATGIEAIDGPWLDVADTDGFGASVARAREAGFDGKWAIHPSQVAALNEAFAPTQREFDQASAVLEALARAESGEGRGAVMFEGAMIDEASRKLAAQIVARGDAAKLERSEVSP